MAEEYFDLKKKLEDLGYNNTLPTEAVPLVQCILADLLQTTSSLQHYMELSKDALSQRDSLMLEAEPYKTENAKLIQENCCLHREVMLLKEENERLRKDNTRKLKSISEELIKKDSTITKLKYDIRELSLRSLCAETSSSRNKSRKKETDIQSLPKICICQEKVSNSDKEILDLKNKICSLQETNNVYYDEIVLLKNQVEHRDNEIIRLNILLESGRFVQPCNSITNDGYKSSNDSKVKSLIKRLNELESVNITLKTEVRSAIEKQHEAMLRALNLADKNKQLEEEIGKVDALALKVEDDCNKRLGIMMNDINFLQTKIENLSLKNSELQKELSVHTKEKTKSSDRLLEDLNIALKEKEILQKEVADLLDLNKSLQSKIFSLSQTSKDFHPTANSDNVSMRDTKQCPSKNELELLLQNERVKYEKYVLDIQDKLQETLSLFNTNLLKSKEKNHSNVFDSQESKYIRDLQNKLCESEQKRLLLQNENDEIKAIMKSHDRISGENYKEVISQLNAENTELSKENILLSQQISHLKNINMYKNNDQGDFHRKNIQKLNDEINKLNHEIQILRKDKQEYHLLYKETMDLLEKSKRDLVYKQNVIEQLEAENCSYKLTNRNGKASAGQLQDECNHLREEIKRMQTDVIKEKTIASQIKNIQLETERSSNAMQNELLCVQKKLSLAKDNIELLEKKNNDLKSEIATLKNDKSSLIETIKKIDQEKDKLVIELDHKTETCSTYEQKVKCQTYELSKLESEISEYKRKLNANKVTEHKLIDYEAQIRFLNGEITRISQQYDNAVIENKHLQNSLADATGNLKIVKIEYEKSRKEVDSLKQQLQHYVAEIRRIEELLSEKEAERSDMLEQFASLSVEANILENTNHSLESESASKSMQLQSYVNKIQTLESKLLDKDNIIESQKNHIDTMTCKIHALESEIKLVNEEKVIFQQNIAYLKSMCNNLQSEQKNMNISFNKTDSELKLYENKIKELSTIKERLQDEKDRMKNKLSTMETLLSNARREIIELKLALQDVTSTSAHISMNENVDRISSHSGDHKIGMSQDELELPLLLQETIHEVTHEEDEDSSHYHEIRKHLSKYTHGSTI